MPQKQQQDTGKMPVERMGKMSMLQAGVQWLLDLQNSDGGIPTFCRGWGKLPFDRSSPDLTAHALRVWLAWSEAVNEPAARARLCRGVGKALKYLANSQRFDGSWAPLWFGNQRARGQENPTYGTALVVQALVDVLQGAAKGLVNEAQASSADSRLRRAVEWLLSAQNGDGSWGGAAGVAGSIEETALAVEALAAGSQVRKDAALLDAALRGAGWLVEHTQGGKCFPPAPIGLYFARLWYHERLYPVIFTVAALGRLLRVVGQ